MYTLIQFKGNKVKSFFSKVDTISCSVCEMSMLPHRDNTRTSYSAMSLQLFSSHLVSRRGETFNCTALFHEVCLFCNVCYSFTTIDFSEIHQKENDVKLDGEAAPGGPNRVDCLNPGF